MKYLNKLGLALVFALGLMSISFTPSQATVVVDPGVGGTFDFDWTGGLGPIDGIAFGTDTDWSMTVAVDSTLSLVAATDKFVPGDEFELVFDDNVIAWGSEAIVGGFFEGKLLNLLLTAGLHTFSLNVTALAPGFTTGVASMEFGTASAVSAVPLPAALPLFAGGLGFLGLIGWRKKRMATA